MAVLHPFRAYRYSRQSIPDLSRVVTQPYDKISPELQQSYYDRSPYNVARITKSLEKNTDPDTDYSGAGAELARWTREGVLIEPPATAFYAYYQEFELDGETRVRKGLVGALDLEAAGSGILPHERTMAEPKQDRLRLMRSLESNDDLIFMLYTDERLVVNGILDAAAAAPSELEARDDFGVLHRVWTVSDPADCKRIHDAMVAEELFIADGHHRYETALTFKAECEGRGWRPAAVESFDKRMVACFNSADAGLAILPTHRLVRGLDGFDSELFLRSAARYFDVVPLESPEALWAAMREGAERGHHFGFYAADRRKPVLLTLREEAKVDPLMLAHAEVYRHLDVSILHTLVLDRLLGINEAKLVAPSHVDYARARAGCIRRVNEGGAQAVFFLNPTTVEQVQRVALLGERMPQKSTDFYPKLLTGLLFMKMRIEK
jgi:uncharacterized protein (DUF1015 family)